jgi:uncharacterized protein YutD
MNELTRYVVEKERNQERLKAYYERRNKWAKENCFSVDQDYINYYGRTFAEYIDARWWEQQDVDIKWIESNDKPF